MRTFRVFHGRLEPFPGLPSGKTSGTTGNIGVRIENKHTTAGMHERRERGIMQGTTDRDGGDLSTLLREQCTRIQAVTAIIAGTGQHDDTGILHGKILIVQQPHRRIGNGRGRHTHQRHAIIKQRTLHAAHGVGIIGAI